MSLRLFAAFAVVLLLGCPRPPAVVDAGPPGVQFGAAPPVSGFTWVETSLLKFKDPEARPVAVQVVAQIQALDVTGSIIRRAQVQWMRDELLGADGVVVAGPLTGVVAIAEAVPQGTKVELADGGALPDAQRVVVAAQAGYLGRVDPIREALSGRTLQLEEDSTHLARAVVRILTRASPGGAMWLDTRLVSVADGVAEFSLKGEETVASTAGDIRLVLTGQVRVRLSDSSLTGLRVEGRGQRADGGAPLPEANRLFELTRTYP